MRVNVTDELIAYLSELSKLEVDDMEKEIYKVDLENILNYMKKLDEIDTSKVEDMVHPFEKRNIFREDEVTNGDMRETMLANAPETKGDFFKVFKTVEE